MRDSSGNTDIAADSRVSWEADGRIPVLKGDGRNQLPAEEVNLAIAIMNSCGLILFRGFDISEQDFITWTHLMGGSQGFTRMAPAAGHKIGLHTEDAKLRSLPAWVWFYAVEPSADGGATLLCDGELTVASLSLHARSFLEEHDVLYWWRLVAPYPPYRGPVFVDPPGVGRNFRGPMITQYSEYCDYEVLCKPLIRSRIGGRLAFANQILIAVDKDGPPQLGWHHVVRTADKESLPRDLISELKTVTSSLQFSVRLGLRDVLWLDNIRFMHGREAFEGVRKIVVRQTYHSDQCTNQSPATDTGGIVRG